MNGRRIETFWNEPTGEAELSLRRFVFSTKDKPCPTRHGYHHASEAIGRCPRRLSDEGRVAAIPVAEFAGDPRWPTHCECGYEFVAADEWQVNQDVVYRRTDSDVECTLHTMPPGGMYDAFWMSDWARGPDGIALTVMLPTDPPTPWLVDSEASNCTMARNDDPDVVDLWSLLHVIGRRMHKCWVRVGNPRLERVHVDKEGHTCAAGAGSIAAPGYHGFLHHGVLYDA